jgi:serine/threonine-protein kinase
MTTSADDPALWATAPPVGAADSPAGAVLASVGYQLERLIGEGTAGQVWYGRRIGDGRPVAVKVLHSRYAADSTAVYRFLRERNALRAADHPHLVRVHDLVFVGDVFAIVMDYVDGENLRRAIRGGWDTDRSLTVLAQVATALDAIHSKKIVHRDVKPDNILVTWRGGQPFAHLTDFGVAHMADGVTLTRHAELVGTPAYLAPELSTGRPAGPPVDIYSLGITGYELLSGVRPFKAETTLALLREHLEESPSQPSGMPAPMWEVLCACLAKQPEDRPAAAELASRLVALRRQPGALPAGAPPPQPSTPSVAFAFPSPTADRPMPVRREEVSPAERDEPPVEQPFALATGRATVKLPDPPTPSQRRKRWPMWVAGLAVLCLIAAGAGVWLGRRAHPPGENRPLTAAYLTVTATSTSSGVVQLTFDDLTTTPGFETYTIFRDATHLSDTTAHQPYMVPGLDPATEYCFSVLALLYTSTPPTGPGIHSAPAPTCLRADGRTQ